MELKKITCKTALSNSSLPGLRYSLNPYRGCSHKCAYCYVPNVLRVERERWGEFVEIRENMPLVLSKELRRKKPGVVGISTVTDPYQPAEKKYKITRYCLEQLLLHDFPICIQTKSKLVIRDKDLISRFSNVELMVSIATMDDSERKLLEPCSSSIKERFEILEKFSDVKVKKSVFLGPIYPTVTADDISEMVSVLSMFNVSEIMIDKFHLKPGVLESVKKSLFKKKQLLNSFINNLKDKTCFERQREQLLKEGKKENIRVTDAF